MAYKITDECIACGACKDECPVEAISEGDIYVIDADACIDCGACAGACPVDAPVEEQFSIRKSVTNNRFITETVILFALFFFVSCSAHMVRQ